VAHAYFALDPDILWNAIQNDVRELQQAIAEVRKAEAGR